MENERNGTVLNQQPTQPVQTQSIQPTQPVQTQPVQPAQPVQTQSVQPTQPNSSTEVTKPRKNWWKFFGMFILWTLFGLLISRIAPILLLIGWISWMVSDFKDSVTTSSINENQTSWLYIISWYAWWWDNYNYSLYAVDNYEESLSLSTTDYEWLKWLYKYNEYIYLDLTFDNGELVDWKIVDRENQKDLWDPTNINWVYVVWEDHVNRISKHLRWDKFTVEEDDLIYNDTNKKYTITIYDTWWQEKDPIELEGWEYYVNDDFWSIEAMVK